MHGEIFPAARKVSSWFAIRTRDWRPSVRYASWPADCSAWLNDNRQLAIDTDNFSQHNFTLRASVEVIFFKHGIANLRI